MVAQSEHHFQDTFNSPVQRFGVELNLLPRNLMICTHVDGYWGEMRVLLRLDVLESGPQCTMQPILYVGRYLFNRMANMESVLVACGGEAGMAPHRSRLTGV